MGETRTCTSRHVQVALELLKQDLFFPQMMPLRVSHFHITPHHPASIGPITTMDDLRSYFDIHQSAIDRQDSLANGPQLD